MENPTPTSESLIFSHGQRILPVLTIERSEDALPLVSALAEAGLTTVEITLRTPVALGAISSISRKLPDVRVGAGSVLDASTFISAVEAGADFLVSPGATEVLYETAGREEVSWIPGVATASEVMRGLDAGIRLFKLFPASSLGGPSALSALGGPLSQARFCPTGGINAESANDYLRLANVVAVGGSWMVPNRAVIERDWRSVFHAARAAVEATAGYE